MPLEGDSQLALSVNGLETTCDGKCPDTATVTRRVDAVAAMRSQRAHFLDNSRCLVHAVGTPEVR